MGFMDIVFLSLTEVFGDTSFRWFAQTNNPKYFAGGFFGYIGVIYYLIESFKDDNVLYVNGMWDGLSGVIESAFAYIVLGDRFEVWTQYVGLFFILIGVFLMKMV